MNINTEKNLPAIAITGCGYIGKRLALSLLNKHIITAGFVSSENSLHECLNKNINCEIIDLDKTPAGLSLNLNGQHLIYLVPPPRFGKIDTRIRHFLQAIEKQAPEKFILISTTGVYGNCSGEWVDESAPLNPIADRAFRRVDAERQVQDFCNRQHIPFTILRVPGIYGPEKIPLTRIKSGQAIVNKQDSPFTNRIHADDLVAICEQALLTPAITGIYNVSDGQPGTMYDYFASVALAMNLPVPPAISLMQAQQELSAGMLSYMAESRRISNKKLIKDFSLVLKYPNLQAGLTAICQSR